MMRAEREELLRRYLEGEMTLEQEHDFIIQVALDKELRHELKAQQTIDRAFRKDRAVDPSAYAPLQASVAGMIAASTPEKAPAASGGAIAGRSLGGTQRWLLGSLAGVGLLAGIAILGLATFGDEGVDRQRTDRLTEPAPLVVPQLPRDESEATTGFTADDRDASGNRSEPAVEAGTEARPAALRIRPRGRGVVTSSGSGSGIENASSRNLGPTRRGGPSAAPNGSATSEAADAVANGHPDTTAEDSTNVSTRTSVAQDSIDIGVRLRWKK